VPRFPAAAVVAEQAGARVVHVDSVLPRHGRTRLWAPALLLPATWLAGRGLAVLAALLG